jgi:hypothetical protein
MDIDTQIEGVRNLIEKREEIDAELSSMLGVTPKSERLSGARPVTRKGTRHALARKSRQIEERRAAPGGPSLLHRIPSEESDLRQYHLRALRALLGLLAFLDGAPAIRKSSTDFPPFIAAVNHFGLNPRPAQVSAGFCGLRYFGATGPLTPFPGRNFSRRLPSGNRLSFASSDSRARR